LFRSHACTVFVFETLAKSGRSLSCESEKAVAAHSFCFALLVHQHISITDFAELVLCTL
jgi:hypothetical protein